MLEWILLTGLVSLFIGVILTLAVQQWRIIRSKTEDEKRTAEMMSVQQLPVPVEMPQELMDKLTQPHPTKEETTTINGEEFLLAVNLLGQFFFREAQTNGLVRRFLLQRINKEMEEGISEGTVSRIIKGLKIYDIDLGSKGPSITRVAVKSVQMDEDKQNIQSLDVSVHLDYSGSATIGIDVLAAFGQTAFVSAKIDRLEGDLHLSFAREPYAHWAVAFSPPPQMDVTVGSRIQGRSYPAITEVLATVIQTWIQRQHSFPFYEVRTKPFFMDANLLLKRTPLPGSVIRPGTLEVTVCKLERMDQSLQADGVFCILGADSCSWVDLSPSEEEGHIHLEIRMLRKRDRPLGFIFHSLHQSDDKVPSAMDQLVGGLADRENKAGLVVVGVEPGSNADEAGFRSGDVIMEVDDVPIYSAGQFLQSVTSTKVQYVIVRVDRFIPSIKQKMADPNVTRDNKDVASLYPVPEDMLASHREHIGQIVGLEIKRTNTYPMAKEVVMNEVKTFRITPSQRFLNLSVWLTGVSDPGAEESSRNVLATTTEAPKPKRFSLLTRLFRSSDSKESYTEPYKELRESRLAYANVSLAEVASDCHLNTQGHHVSAYQLFPADPKASLGLRNPLSKQLGFDPRLCYGDIVLSFVYKPDEESSEPKVEYDEARKEAEESLEERRSRAGEALDVVIYQLKRPHEWSRPRTGAGIDEPRICVSCQASILIRPAAELLLCPRCDSACHRKCVKEIPEGLKWCSVNRSIAKIDDFYISNVPIPSCNGANKWSLMEGMSPFQLAEGDEQYAVEAAVDRLQAREHDESLVRMAKVTGRNLFGHLGLEDRRAKLSSLMDKVEAAVQAETVHRYELASEWEKSSGFYSSPSWLTSSSTDNNDEAGGNPRWIEVELAAVERKRQALILLLLYLNAGWQDVLMEASPPSQ